MAFLNMIPYIGPWLGGALVVFITLPQGLFSIVAALICILAVQAADNWFAVSYTHLDVYKRQQAAWF